MSGSSVARKPDTSLPVDESSGRPSPANALLPDLVLLQDQLDDIQNVQASINTLLQSKRGNALGLEQLAAIVQASVSGITSLLQDRTHITKLADRRLDECIRQLRNVDNHLHDPKAYGKSAKAKFKLRALTFRPYDPYLPYRECLRVAFVEFQEAAKSQDRNQNVPAIAHTPATQPLLSSVPEIIAELVEAKPSPPDGRWATIRDTIQGVLKVAIDVKDLVGEPAGPIIGLLAGTGLTIIEMLNDMEDNWEGAADLGVRISELLQIIAGFLKHRRSKQSGVMYTATIKQLDFFSTTLESVREDLAVLKKQGRLKQGVSHSRNKEDLQGWKAKIDDARNTLQFQLALHNVDTAEATSQTVDRLELLGLLGDGDTGASEKVADLEDLICLPGTRRDILDRAEQWLKDPYGSRVLWISGVAGCGKSAVAATIADRQTKAGAPIAVFHFARANQIRNKRVVCSLARQTTGWHSGFLEPFILASFREDRDLATKPIASQFDQLLMKPLRTLPAPQPVTLFVLDAFDEWDDHTAAAKLLELIGKSNPQLPSTIRFVLTSRNESHLVNQLTSSSMEPLVTRYPLDNVLPKGVNHDIRIYVKKRFERIRSSSSRNDRLESDWPGEGGVEALVKEAGGLFQWASTAMSHIQRPGPRQRLDEILKHKENFAGLEGLYVGMLKLIFEQELPSVRKLLPNVLGAILLAPTPINFATVTYLCPGDPDDSNESNVGDVLACLGSLLIVPDDRSRPIKISHPTVFDIFTTAAKCSDNRFYIDITAHHKVIASSCLQGMTLGLEASVRDLLLDFTKTSAELRDQALEDIPAGIRYASRHWGYHLLHSCHYKGQADDRTVAASTARVGSDLVAQMEHCTSEGSDIRKLHAYLHDFCTQSLMNWLEVLSLTGLASSAVSIAIDAGRWYSLHTSTSSSPMAQSLLNDIRRFSAMFLNPISTSAAHIRPSILPLAPKETELFRHYLKSSSRHLKVSRGPLDRRWPAALWMASHTQPVGCVAISSDGRTIASGSDDSTVRLWDVGSGAQKGDALTGHTRMVMCLVISSDGRMVASGSLDSTVRLWDVDSGAQKGDALTGHTDGATCLTISSDGSMVASGSNDSTIRLWDVGSGAQRGDALTGHTEMVTCLAISSDGSMIASGSYDSTVRLWDVDSGAQKGDALTGHTRGVACLAISSDGSMVASGSDDKTVRLWDVDSGAQKGDALIGHTHGVNCLAISSDGSTVASGSDDSTVRLWDVDSGAQKGDALTGHTRGVACLAISSDGSMIASGSDDRTVRLWDVDSGAQKGDALTGHTRGIRCLAMSSDGSMVTSGSDDGTVRLWDVDPDAQKGDALTGHMGWVRCLAISSDGRMVASGSDDRTVRLWDVDSGAQKGDALTGHWGRVRCLTISSDGSMVASGSDDSTVRVWDVDSGAQKGDALTGHTGMVRCLVISSDGSMIASGSDDNTVRVWDLDSGAQKGDALIGHTHGVTCLAMSSDGSMVASGSYDSTVRLWDVDSGAQKGDALIGHRYLVDQLAFSPSGLQLMSRSPDVLLAWDLSGGVPSLLPNGLEIDEVFLMMGAIAADGWIWFQNKRWFWLPVQSGEWCLRGTCLVVRLANQVFMFDVSGIMFLVE